MRERLDDHSRFLESQLAGLEALVKEKGEINVVVPAIAYDEQRAMRASPPVVPKPMRVLPPAFPKGMMKPALPPSLPPPVPPPPSSIVPSGAVVPRPVAAKASVPTASAQTKPSPPTVAAKVAAPATVSVPTSVPKSIPKPSVPPGPVQPTLAQKPSAEKSSNKGSTTNTGDSLPVKERT